LVDYDPKFAPLTASSLVSEGDLDLDEYSSELLVGHPLATYRDGEGTWNVYSDAAQVDAGRTAATSFDYFPWLTAVWLVPAVLATDVLSAVGVGSDARDEIVAGEFDTQHQLTAGLLAAAAAAVVMLTARMVLSGSEFRQRLLACGVACAFAFGTTAWSIASRAMWQHAPSLLFVTVAMYCLVRLAGFDKSGHSGGGPALPAAMAISLALAVVSRPTNVWLVGATTVWLIVRRRDLVLPYFGAAAVTAAVFLALNAMLLGALQPLYYSGSRLLIHDRLAEAVSAQWVSPSRGLLWISPFLALAIPGAVIAWRRGWDRLLIALLVIVPIGVAFSSSAFVTWWAGHSFGARFMTEAVPVLVLLAIPAADRLIPNTLSEVRYRWAGLVLVFALVAPSVLINGAAAARSAAWCWNAKPQNIDANPNRIWSISQSQPATVLIDVAGGTTQSSCEA
jgi:hypothetical protein